MATNFKISAHHSGDRLHVDLRGDFDGSAALELIHFLEKKSQREMSVSIHTEHLQQVHPFGREMFRKNLCLLNDYPVHLSFEGKKASRIAPEHNRFV
jgi:hypothetical protein